MTNRNSNYFHTASPQTLRWLAAVCTQAADNDRAVNLLVREDNSLQVKAGGAWSAPLESEFDMSRDVTPEPVVELLILVVSDDGPPDTCPDCDSGRHGIITDGRCECCGVFVFETVNLNTD